MDKETLLKRYKMLGAKLSKNNRLFQLKQLKDCMEMIQNSFDPEFDGRHALVQRLNQLNEALMGCGADKEKQKKYGDAMCVFAACIAFFQEVKSE
jgi:hypothetical protein